MEASVGRRLGIGEALLEVVRLVKRILNILSNILMMSDESYNHYLALTDQMMFNVKNLLVYLLFNFMTIIPNTCFLVDFYNVYPFQKTFNGREESCKGGHCHKQGKLSYLEVAKKGKYLYRSRTEKPRCDLFNVEGTNTRRYSLVGL